MQKHPYSQCLPKYVQNVPQGTYEAGSHSVMRGGQREIAATANFVS
jgi:hypothetical protein